MRLRQIPLFTVIALLIALPASAAAQDNSAIDQYTESVPEAGTGSGGGSGGSGGSSGGSGGDSSAPAPTAAPAPAPATTPATTSEAPTDTSAPSGAGDKQKDKKAKDRKAKDKAEKDKAKKTKTKVEPQVGESLSATTESDEGGIGVGLPIALGVSLLAVLAFLLIRRARAGGAGTA